MVNALLGDNGRRAPVISYSGTFTELGDPAVRMLQSERGAASFIPYTDIQVNNYYDKRLRMIINGDLPVRGYVIGPYSTVTFTRLAIYTVSLSPIDAVIEATGKYVEVAIWKEGGQDTGALTKTG